MNYNLSYENETNVYFEINNFMASSYLIKTQ